MRTVLGVFLRAAVLGPACAAPAADWLSPGAIVAAPNGRSLYIACATGNSVLTLDAATRQLGAPFAPLESPSGLAVSRDGSRLFVTCAAPRSKLCIIDVATGRIAAEVAVGHTAMAPVASPDGQTLYVCNRFDGDVSELDLRTRREIRRIRVHREPVAATLTPDGRRLLVTNFLPVGRADVAQVGAVVTVIDTARGEIVDDLRLPTGTSAVSDVRVAPGGETAVVTHVIGRFWLPTTGVERGRMNSSALTVIDLRTMRVINTVTLDEAGAGAANPWGTAWSADGRTLVVTHAGTHEVSVIDYRALLNRLAQLPASAAAATDFAPYGSPAAGRGTNLKYDLAFLQDLRERRPLSPRDLGPRAVAVVGRSAWVPNYFSDTVSLVDLDDPRAEPASIALGPRPQMSAARRGELHFHDAQLCFEGWQSCASCHPADARTDGLNWDLLNDGRGTPKNTRSLLLAFRTPPAMSTGVRANASVAVRAGIKHILFTAVPPEAEDELDAYIRSLQPVPSPHLVDGQPSPAARRGEALFRSSKVGCVRCHPPPLYTDLKSHDVGTRVRHDPPAARFDTPTLIELWRTAPYLHEGSAVTLREVLTTANPQDRHGRTSRLTADELLDLAAFLVSL